MIFKSVKNLPKVAIFVGAIGFLMAPIANAADEGSAARGGRLYDKWYSEVGQDAPTESHKLYPAGSKYAAEAKSNWRCKECHGWDGMGAKGAYSSGKHFTGIKGINGMIGADPSAIAAVLTAPKHGYGKYLEDSDIMDLANFVSYGQSNYANYVTNGKAVGDVAKGAQIYGTVCVLCHGTEGKLPKDMPPLASLMGNPWEIMHKVLNGQPNEAMPALRAFDHQSAADVLAYITAKLPE